MNSNIGVIASSRASKQEMPGAENMSLHARQSLHTEKSFGDIESIMTEVANSGPGSLSVGRLGLIEKANPRKHKSFQWLTVNVDYPNDPRASRALSWYDFQSKLIGAHPRQA